MTEVQKKTGEIVESSMTAPAPTVSQAPAEQGSMALMRMIEKAIIDPSFDVAKMEQLLGVKERWEANEARKAFVQAMAAFKADPPRIVKNRQVSFRNKAGTLTEYDHATLDQICEVVGKALAVHGLSHTWEVKQHDNAAVEVTCILTHAQGHAERVTMRGMPDDSGGKNLIQQIGSTVTYLQRYSLLSAAGLAAADQDMDGVIPSDPINAEQKKRLIDLQAEVGADTTAFLKYMGVNNLDDLPSNRFDQAVTALEQKRKQGGAAP